MVMGKSSNGTVRVLSLLFVISIALIVHIPHVSGKNEPEYSDDDQSTDKKKYPDYAKMGGFTGIPDRHTLFSRI